MLLNVRWLRAPLAPTGRRRGRAIAGSCTRRSSSIGAGGGNVCRSCSMAVGRVEGGVDSKQRVNKGITGANPNQEVYM